MANISDLRFDDKNFNQHTEYGMSLLEKSLRENGAGRSILIDKDNNIIAGNGIIEAAGNIGLEDLQIVETDGTKIVAVKRTDIALDSKEGRQMALAECIGVTTNKYSGDDVDDFNKSIGNYFETKEEAEKAVEKLKAWKRLKDKGVTFGNSLTMFDLNGCVGIRVYIPKGVSATDDFEIIFGGEE